ncbi:MAG: hypothetical protein KTR16_08280 [Acidiferrobacterales bacterium]|nr:hypothetical protein [Acidiferrobacterales bacterium]
MKYTLITNALIAGLIFSSASIAQGDAETASNEANEVKERNKGDRDGDGKRRSDRNNNFSDRTIRTIDTDEDGKVSIEEYMANAQQRFSDLDLDGNNFVTAEEAKEAAEIMRERQREARSSLDNRRNKRSDDSETE